MRPILNITKGIEIAKIIALESAIHENLTAKNSKRANITAEAVIKNLLVIPLMTISKITPPRTNTPKTTKITDESGTEKYFTKTKHLPAKNI